MAYPIYPVKAQCSNVKDEADVIVEVGTDGKVLDVMDGARGTNPQLVLAAKENARKSEWSQFPQKSEFPWFHSIHYVFRLQGKPTALPIVPPTVRTRLPDEIEITAIPCNYDFLELKPATPSH
jgi:hypothetical protein